MTVLVLVLAVMSLFALVAALAHEVGLDGYGHRPAPRSLNDEAEPRWVQLGRLAG